MSERTASCYKAVFKFIEANVFKLEPSEFITDFEVGMRNAIQECFPGIRLRGCWYHFCAALRKKLLKLGLHALLKQNGFARHVKKMMMCLPLLPAENFVEGYDYIKKKAGDWKISDQFEQMFAYFEQYWFAMVLFFFSIIIINSVIFS